MVNEQILAELTKPRKRTLWGFEHTVTPALVDEKFGDGQKLIALSPIMDRPNYYIIQGDSLWDLDCEEFRDTLDDIYDAIEAQYGNDDPIEGDEPEPFPALSDGGCSWWELDTAERITAILDEEAPAP